MQLQYRLCRINSCRINSSSTDCRGTSHHCFLASTEREKSYQPFAWNILHVIHFIINYYIDFFKKNGCLNFTFLTNMAVNNFVLGKLPKTSNFSQKISSPTINLKNPMAPKFLDFFQLYLETNLMEELFSSMQLSNHLQWILHSSPFFLGRAT